MGSSVVQVRNEGGVAVVVIDNPPVNALKQEVRAGLQNAFNNFRGDKNIEAVVLACAGRTFVAGADITEFGKPMQPPDLPEVSAVIEGLDRPVVAAVHGTPLGGGLELALSCHFRIAARGTRLGLPEIKLGIIPGAGGTQRLPRLIGVEKALRMILSGDPIPAEQALKDGLIEEIFEGDPVTAGLAFVRKVLAERRPLRRLSQIDDQVIEFRNNPAAFDQIVAGLQGKRTQGLHAPAAAIKAVRGAFELPFEEGRKRERALFSELVVGDQSKAQRHIFFAEREAAKVVGLGDAKPRDIKRAAVIGAGTMGGGIAMSFANAGIPVTVVETGKDLLARGLETVGKNYRASVARGSLKDADVERRMGLINGATDLQAVADADIVVEAVFEDMAIKQKLFGELDRVAKPDAVLATNTSYLDINAIAKTTQRPPAVLGMHFFSPANVMRLLEIVRAEKTAPDTLATAIAVARKLGKIPVVVGVSHGFVGNRMLNARSIEAERLLLEGALPQDVDAALTEFGFPMGPFAMGDLAGLDVGWRARKADGRKAEIADALCEAGRFGQKTGRGFYLYEAGSRGGRPDPDVERMIVEASLRHGITRRAIDKEEIVERLLYPMINEGARILDEGIAQRASDIDVIWVYGYGWPVWRGGPMFYADQVGLAKVRDRLKAFAARSKDARLEPAPLLTRLAAEGKGFASLPKPAK